MACWLYLAVGYSNCLLETCFAVEQIDCETGFAQIDSAAAFEQINSEAVVEQIDSEAVVGQIDSEAGFEQKYSEAAAVAVAGRTDCLTYLTAGFGNYSPERHLVAPQIDSAAAAFDSGVVFDSEVVTLYVKPDRAGN